MFDGSILEVMDSNIDGKCDRVLDELLGDVYIG